jgi:copper resistance protein B
MFKKLPGVAAGCLCFLLLLPPAMANEMDGMGKQPLQLFIGGDRMEYQWRDEANTAVWDLQGWWGGDYNKAWLKTEGEWRDGIGLESAELQLLFSRAIATYWDLQLGVRHDFEPNPKTSYLAFGVLGLAPYLFELDLAGFVSEDGDLSARAEAEYDLRITQRWILQPRIELNAAFSDVPELEISSGITALEAGLRLRYAIRPEFAPYLGVEYSRVYGASADAEREEGFSPGGWGLILGLRAWF